MSLRTQSKLPPHRDTYWQAETTTVFRKSAITSSLERLSTFFILSRDRFTTLRLCRLYYFFQVWNYTGQEEDFNVWLNGLVITKDIGYLAERGLSHWICLHKEILAEVSHTQVNGFMITKCVGNEMLGKWMCVD